MSETTALPTLAEDLLLVLFDPPSGTIHSEGSPLFHVLAGAVLTELALLGAVDIDRKTTLRGRQVRVTSSPAPTDELLLGPWQRVERKPTDAYSLVLEIGPALRALTLDRLVARGALRREKTKTLCFIPGTRLRLADSEGGAGRRSELVASLRSILVDGAEPSVRSAALGALVSASGALPAMYRDIPWSGDVQTRGRELQRGRWGARIVGDAVAAAAAAVLSTSLLVTVGLPGLPDGTDGSLVFAAVCSLLLLPASRACLFCFTHADVRRARCSLHPTEDTVNALKVWAAGVPQLIDDANDVFRVDTLSIRAVSDQVRVRIQFEVWILFQEKTSSVGDVCCVDDSLESGPVEGTAQSNANGRHSLPKRVLGQPFAGEFCSLLSDLRNDGRV